MLNHHTLKSAGRQLTNLNSKQQDAVNDALDFPDRLVRRWFDKLSPEQDRQDPDNTPLNTNSKKVKEVKNDHTDTAVHIPTSEYERAESASTDTLGMLFITSCSKD